MIEPSNCIDAANLDFVGVLNSWHARIDLCTKRRIHEINKGLALNRSKGMLNMTN